MVVPLSIRTSPVFGSTTSPQAIRPSSLAAALGSPVSTVLGLVERLEDRLVGRELGAHGPQQRHRRELARLVDPDAQGVLLGDLQLDPAPALGDDAAGVELAVAGLDLDDEVDARACGGAG